MKNISAIVLDFDGLIIRDSEFFKKDAWKHVFAPYGERAKIPFNEAEQKFGGGRGGDRFDILRHTYLGLGVPADKVESFVASGAQTFDDYVQNKILEAGVEQDTYNALAELSKTFKLYVNSATPKEALERTVKNIKIDRFFRDVLGRPNDKIKNFNLVLQQEHILPDNMIFVGDGDSDYKAAKEFGCTFVGFANRWNKWDGVEKPFYVIKSLSELPAYIKGI